MKFEKWFAEQHGKRPSQKETAALALEISRIEDIADGQRRIWRECRDWDNERSSALYAWNIKDKDKK